MTMSLIMADLMVIAIVPLMLIIMAMIFVKLLNLTFFLAMVPALPIVLAHSLVAAILFIVMVMALVMVLVKIMNIFIVAMILVKMNFIKALLTIFWTISANFFFSSEDIRVSNLLKDLQVFLQSQQTFALILELLQFYYIDCIHIFPLR